MPVSGITRCVVLCALVGGLGPPGLSADETADSLRHAGATLEALKRTLKPGVAPWDSVRALDVAAAALEGLLPPPKPDLVPSDRESDEAAAHEVAAENERRLRAWTHASQRFARRRDGLRTRWIGLLGTALRMESFRKGYVLDEAARLGEARRRRRALTLLVATARSDAANEIREAISTWLRSERLYDEPHPLLASFEALPEFESPDVLRWLRVRFVGRERNYPLISFMTRRGGAMEETLGVDVPVLALEAIARHTHLPGEIRLRTVRDLVAAYRPLEARAERGGEDATIWGRVGEAAIAATWNLARNPADEGGAPLSSMAQLARWLRRNGTLAAAAWQD